MEVIYSLNRIPTGSKHIEIECNYKLFFSKKKFWITFGIVNITITVKKKRYICKIQMVEVDPSLFGPESGG